MNQSARIATHAEARKVLRRVGVAPEKIDEILADLPDPFDINRAEPLLESYGITADHLVDRMGGSP